jgi:DNA-binding GntR family transcriptional regulator
MTPLTASNRRRSSTVATVGDDLDQNSPVPLYEQLAALLRDGIDVGRITVRLPSELALTQQYGVSRGTAHRAVMILVESGYVRISRGRGTFVIPPGERRA